MKAELKEPSELSDDELKDQIENIEEENPDEEPEEEKTSEGTTEDEPDLELPEEEPEEEPAEEEEEAEETSEEETPEEVPQEYAFKSQDDAEVAYKNLLALQKRQATELGELRKTATPTPETPEEEAEIPLTDDELGELLVTDPVEAGRRLREEVSKGVTQDIETRRQQEDQTKRTQKLIADGEKAIEKFFVNDAHAEMPETEQQEFFDFIREHHNKSKPLTLNDLNRYHGYMNYDKNLKNATKAGREKAIDDITDAQPRIKTLSTAKNSKAKGKVDIRKLATVEEVESHAKTLNDDELEEAINKLDNV